MDSLNQALTETSKEHLLSDSTNPLAIAPNSKEGLNDRRRLKERALIDIQHFAGLIFEDPENGKIAAKKLAEWILPNNSIPQKSSLIPGAFFFGDVSKFVHKSSELAFSS